MVFLLNRFWLTLAILLFILAIGTRHFSLTIVYRPNRTYATLFTLYSSLHKIWLFYLVVVMLTCYWLRSYLMFLACIMRLLNFSRNLLFLRWNNILRRKDLSHGLFLLLLSINIRLSCLILTYDLVLSFSFLLISILVIFSSFFILLSKLIHLFSNLLLYLFEVLAIDKLWKWIEFLLVEQCDKVVAKPSHFRFSML